MDNNNNDNNNNYNYNKPIIPQMAAAHHRVIGQAREPNVLTLLQLKNKQLFSAVQYPNNTAYDSIVDFCLVLPKAIVII